jgi:transcription antitermination factor NusG
MKNNWYVLYTKSRCEKKIADLLSKRNVENYCPLNRVYRQWSDRKKMVTEPLFNSYVFIHACEEELNAIKKLSNNIVNVVYWLGKPAIIKNEEIEQIRYFLNEYSNVTIEKQPVRMNEMVRIIKGPFRNLEGTVAAIKNNMLVLSLPSLGYKMMAEVNLSNIEILNKDFSRQNNFETTTTTIPLLN